jgi:hypothetical protein
MEDRACWLCGTDFTPRVHSQRSCSVECSKRLRYLRERARWDRSDTVKGRARQRCRDWYQRNRARHIANVVERKRCTRAA